MSAVKEEVTELVQDGQEDGSGEEIVGRPTFHVLVERGIANVNAMRVMADRQRSHHR